MLSVVTPFISQESFELANKMLWITGLSLSITVVTGISTFFKPDETWKLNMGAKLNLEALYASWNLEMLEARSKAEASEALKGSLSASKKFLRNKRDYYAQHYGSQPQCPVFSDHLYRSFDQV